MKPPLEGTALIARERLRQVSQEGWTLEHDDQHVLTELLKAAECYLDAADTAERRDDAAKYHFRPPDKWPWHRSWWKPSNDPVKNLIKAGALIAAEIDRLQRLESSQADEQDEQADYEMIITVTAKQLFNRGIWMEACTLLGINEWAVSEGMMDYSHKIELTESQARKLGII